MALTEQTARRPDPTYTAWFATIPREDLWISVLSLGEVERGIPGLPDDESREMAIEWLATAEDALGPRTLAVDRAVCRAWAVVWRRNNAANRAAGVVDELIAATAIVHGLTVVTRNVRDFEHSGCRVLSPWSA